MPKDIIAITLKNEALRELDVDITSFYGYNMSLLAIDYSNPLKYPILRNMVDNLLIRTNAIRNEIKSRTKPLEQDSDLESLVAENIYNILLTQRTFIDFLYDKDKVSVENLVDYIVGQGAWSYLEKTLSIENLRMLMRLDELEVRLSKSRVYVPHDKLQESLPMFKEMIKNTLKAYNYIHKLLPSSFDINIEFTHGDSFWDLKTKTIFISYGAISTYMENSNTIYDITRAIVAGFHELFGHGVHQLYSRNLPESLRLTDEIGFIITTGPVTEGFADIAEHDSYDFLKNSKKELGVSDEMLEYAILSSQNSKLRTALRLYLALLNEKAKRENFDIRSYLIDGLKLPYEFVEWYLSRDPLLKDVFEVFGHAFSGFIRSNLKKELVQEFGEQFLLQHPDIVRKAMATGVWSSKIYPKAVKYFLKKYTES